MSVLWCGKWVIGENYVRAMTDGGAAAIFQGRHRMAGSGLMVVMVRAVGKSETGFEALVDKVY